MADQGAAYTDKELAKMEKKIKQIYSEAQADIEKKIADFNEKFAAKSEMLLKQVDEGKITYEQYSQWMDGQIFQGEQWDAKKDQIIGVIQNANKEAANILNGKTISVFAENANWSHYQMEKSQGVNFGFGLYDAQTVTNLIKNDPQILPKWKINEPKDYIWNAKKVNNSITQGIIQGEGLDKITKRLAKSLSSNNKNTMLTFARTAMTGAQNAGRYQSQQDAKELGIDIVKVWMATLDNHTRVSHQKLDGEERKVGDKWHPFKFSNECRYPGDPQGPPHEVYNCRCTLVSDIKDYPSEFNRYDNIDGKPIKNMSYDEWLLAKIVGGDITPHSFDDPLLKAQEALKLLQEQVINKGADKVFSGIWKDDVTYADWESKKGSIQAKEEYYKKQIEKYKNQITAGQVDFSEYGSEEAYNIFLKYDHLYELSADEKKWLVNEYMSGNIPHIEGKTMGETFQEYFNKAIQTPADVYNESMLHKMEGYLSELKEFEKHGEEYSKLLQQLDDAKKAVKDLTPVPEGPFGVDAYSQKRKDNAWWAKSSKEADKNLRDVCGEVWRDATDAERDAIYEYTQSYHKYNEPLRGYEYGTNRYLGVGKTDLNAGWTSNGKRLNAMTSIIDKSSYDHDMWLQRGCRYEGMDKFFQCDMDLLMHGTQQDLENELLGKTVTEYGFMSCGSSKGRGFDGKIMLNVYTPAGTKMMYVEPFSAFGDGNGKYWDGTSKQSSFGTELETILQQSTQFRVTKIERSSPGSIIWFDIEVTDQLDPQLWQKID